MHGAAVKVCSLRFAHHSAALARPFARCSARPAVQRCVAGGAGLLAHHRDVELLRDLEALRRVQVVPSWRPMLTVIDARKVAALVDERVATPRVPAISPDYDGLLAKVAAGIDCR